MAVILGFAIGALTTWICMKMSKWDKESKAPVIEEKNDDVQSG